MSKAKEKIFVAMETLLEKDKLDVIHVSDIILQAEVSRKTFYRNFNDKYDLVNQYFSHFYDDSFGKITTGEDFDSALYSYLTFCEEKAKLLINAYSSKDSNNLHKYDVEQTRKTYETFLSGNGADIKSKEMSFAIEIASIGGTAMIMQWLEDKEKWDKKLLISLIKTTLPISMKEFLE